jgi:hypothetical protein
MNLISTAMNKSLTFAALLMFISISATGQTSKDTLYLKNGSVVFGKLTGKTKTDYKIQTKEGYLFAFTTDEIERYIPATTTASNTIRDRKIQGLSFIMETGIPVGSSDVGFPIHFTITPTIDYSFNLYHSISAGTGLEYWENLMLPIFAEYRISLSDKNVAPFLNFRIGGLVNLEGDIDDMYYKSDQRGGWTFATGFGLLWPLGSIESFVKLGYRYAFTRTITTYSQTYPPYDIMDEKMNFNCLEMKWGFKF